jgi:hypothetical protein
MRNVLEKFRKEDKKHTFYVQSLFFLISCRLSDNVDKPGTAGKATEDITAHAHCMLDTYGYRHTLRICNTYCFFDYNSGYSKGRQ